MDAASASSIVRELYRLPPGIPMEETFPRSVPRQWSEFQRSGPPIKIGRVLEGMIHGTKALAPPPVMREAFASGTAITEYVEGEGPGGGGKRMILDFLRKVFILLDDKGLPKKMGAFYWVDAHGFLFSPALFGDVDEGAVRRAFDGSSRGSLAITAVRRCHHREARTPGFLERMKYQRKWVFGWYGAAAADVESATDGGDLRTNWQLLGAGQAHGRGLLVSSEERLLHSANLSFRGMDNRRGTHLLYCALALGWREIIPAGSEQSQPSSSLFHTGVDALPDPSWNVLWERSGGTRVLPLFIVSFKLTHHKRPGSPLEKAPCHKMQKTLQ